MNLDNATPGQLAAILAVLLLLAAWVQARQWWRDWKADTELARQCNGVLRRGEIIHLHGLPCPVHEEADR